MQRGIPLDPTLADLALTHFELRLHEHHQRARIRFQRSHHHRNDMGGGNKTDVADGEVHRFSQVPRLKVTRVHAFAHDHAGVVSKLPVQLPRAHIDREHLRSAGLQEAIGKSTRRRSEIRANQTGDIDLKRLQRAFQFQPTAADVAELREDLDPGILRD